MFFNVFAALLKEWKQALGRPERALKRQRLQSRRH
jgi:hypothetical protein